MSRVTYTSTATYPMPVGWKCTKCGRINATTCDIQWNASASHAGLLHSQETQDKAIQQAQNQLAMRVMSIANNIETGKFDPVLNSCVCRGCSHQEPWASIKPNGCVVVGCLMAACFFGILALFCLFLQDWTSLWWMLGIAAALVGIATLSMKKSANYEKKMAPVFAKLKDIERPVLAPDADTLRQKMYGIIAQGSEDIEAIDKVIAKEL